MSVDRSEQGKAGPVGRILRNARALLSGKALGGILSLAYLAIAARGLGPEGMGALVLAHAYAMVIAGVARFQSWQAVIRFGAPMVRDGDDQRFRGLLRYTIRLDLISGVVSVIAALAIAPFAARAFGWSEDIRGLITAYCFATPFLIAATPTGVLRLYDKFKLLGWQLALMPTVRFVGAIILWLTGAGLSAFLIVWIASVFVHGASLWWLGWRELVRREQRPRLFGKAERAADKAWLPFMIKTNLSSSIELMHNNVPVLIVGAVLGGAPAGFLKLAYNLTNLLAQPITLFNQATYPELSRIEAESGPAAMVKVALRSIASAAAIIAPIVLLYFLFRRDLAVAVGGEAFLPAAPLIALMAAAQIFHIAALGLESAVLARGRAGWALTGQATGALAHLAFLSVALASLGVIAAPPAIMTGWSVLIAVLVVALLTEQRRQMQKY
ncbi:lipopolysaccharide biosynthesis protein [Hyphococcus flavus]|uniref:Lipopolysaccharide biosynthesis protein n=1 Tax=Hyphococcus flavus TaxID=1866326 RepID=A0AAF0CEY2_9PROT|nr:lipopolysaccharide biosynthesis protein [Hyphococcus flavus]WDI30223.1 lipopolysaccharide biosynthesis protein [Hyphococcus flavus]